MPNAKSCFLACASTLVAVGRVDDPPLEVCHAGEEVCAGGGTPRRAEAGDAIDDPVSVAVAAQKAARVAVAGAVAGNHQADQRVPRISARRARPHPNDCLQKLS